MLKIFSLRRCVIGDAIKLQNINCKPYSLDAFMCNLIETPHSVAQIRGGRAKLEHIQEIFPNSILKSLSVR